MMREQNDLLEEAQRSLDAARLLRGQGFVGYAASRAYYAMFYVIEAALLGKGLAFSKHRGVHKAFGEHFVKTGVAPREFVSFLIRGMDVRHAGDYAKGTPVTESEADEQIHRAEQMIDWGRESLQSS
jgi:uncharacterized protein (UPF0332 family)